MNNKETRLAYYQANKHIILPKLAEYQRNNKEILSEKKALYYIKRRLHIMLKTIKQRADKKGIPFGVTVEDISIPEVCPVFNRPFSTERGMSPWSPTVDRIVPELGYVPGNVQIISHKANRMKSDSTREELMEFSKWVQSV